MLRLLTLLAFALVPAAVAAPVPREARPEFGRAGLLTRADLERVRFDSRPVKERDPIDKVKGEEPREKVKEEPGKVRPKNPYDVAVHLPWAKFRAGEPVPAYFVLRNNRAQMFGMGSRMDLSGPKPLLHGGGINFDVRDRATGKSVVVGGSASTNCGGGYLVEVPGDGFYCVAADLNRVAAGLPPGEYEVDWYYGALAAAPVPFTVLKGDGPNPPSAARRGSLRFFHLTRGEGDEEYPEKAGAPVVWRSAELDSVSADDVAAALGVGPGGVFAPDLHAIPAADELIEAGVELRPYRDGDHLVVTLRAVAPHARVTFAELPQLHLQIETPADDRDRFRAALEKAAERKEQERAELVTPLTVEARLPAGWREATGTRGTLKVAVLVTAKPLELPRGGDRLVKVQEKLDKVSREPAGERPPVWRGVVRTTATELRVPPPVFPPPERIHGGIY